MSKSSRRRARAKARKHVGERRGVQAPHPQGGTAIRHEPRPRAIQKTARIATPVRASEPGAADAVHALFWRTGLLNVTAIARRELVALFVSPVGWVVAGVFIFLMSGFGFIGTVIAGQQATLDGVFSAVTGFLTLILVPVVTMRLIAEERSQRTLELLLTSPVRDWELAVGKWLGAFAFYVLLVATSAVYVVLFAIYLPGHAGALDFGLVAATYIGMLLVGAAAIAIGLLASSLTKSQVIAYVLSLVGLLVIWYASYGVGLITTPSPNAFFDYVAAYHRYRSFTLGQVTLRDTVYFLSLAVAGLVLTTRVLESRRWR